MSFNKPKRNIRRRHFNEDEEDNENTSIEREDIQYIKNKSKKKDKPKQTLLSFGEELEEADDGEVFKVKKSSRSRRLMKQLDQERKKKKGDEKIEEDSDTMKILNLQEKDLEIKTDDLVVKIKNTESIFLNGQDALIAGRDDYTSEDELETNVGHKFQRKSDRSENMKFFLESGCIPDAAMIHAARKRRQKARELGHDYIPIEEQGTDEKGISRLIREENHDRSDDDDSQERVNMTVNTDALDKEKRRQAFLESQTSTEKLSNEQSEAEEEEWEEQQIRKGVTGAQIVAVHQDSIVQYNSLAMKSNQTPETRRPILMSNVTPIPPPPPIIQPPDPTKCIPVTAAEVLNRIRERLNSLREVHRRHELNYEAVVQELAQGKQELTQGECRAPEIAQRYKYYQELRGYFTDLVECLNEKLPSIVALESRWIHLYGEKASELIERRRQDTRDQAEEVMTSARGQVIRRGPEDDARMRRATEREGRRARRRRARELAPIMSRHMDGMSSDDEVTEQQNLLFKQNKDDIEKVSRELFLDVEDEFSTIKGILSKLGNWRVADIESYKEAYVSFCIPKVISPLVRFQLITWNPIMESAELERSKWYNALIIYSLDSHESEESLRDDPDVRIIPSTIEKIIIPKLTTTLLATGHRGLLIIESVSIILHYISVIPCLKLSMCKESPLEAIVEKIWDPMSTSQTLRLVGITNRLIRDYPNMNETSKPLKALFTAILNKIENSVENDVFIPIFPKQLMDTKHHFFQRQFAMAIKLLRNSLSWQGLISDSKLENIAFGMLLNRYLLAGLRVSTPVDALVKANMIMSTLPRAWLQGKTTDHLKSFAALIRQFAELLDQANPTHNEAWEYSKSMLKIIKPL